MKVLPPIDPTTINNMRGSILTVDTGLTTGCGTIYYMNKSNVGIKVVYDNGYNMVLPAWYARSLVLQNKSLRQTFSQQYILNQQNPPISQLYMEAFQKGEDTTGLYSGPIPYQSTNAIQGSVTTANLLNNQGNAAGLDIITSAILGSNNQTVTLTNDGKLTLGSSGVSSGALTIVTGFGNFQIDSNGNIIQVSGQKIVAQLIDTTSLGADLGFHVPLANRVVDTINGVDTFQVNSSGPSLLAGTLGLLAGTISRIVKFTAAVTTTSTFFNHGLGVVPDFIIITVDGAAATTTRTVEAEFSTMTSTQVKLTGGSSFNVQCLAIKF